MGQMITRRLGDTLHAYAVVSSLQRQGMASDFQVYAAFASLFGRATMPIRPHPQGSRWATVSPHGFAGPIHGEHVRTTILQKTGGN